jgi:hypothetical protein
VTPVPGDVVRTRRGWSISKMNRRMDALGNNVGNDLLVIAVTKEDDDNAAATLCVLSPTIGPVWVHHDDRMISVIK